jgi:hypothetical protein
MLPIPQMFYFLIILTVYFVTAVSILYRIGCYHERWKTKCRRLWGERSGYNQGTFLIYLYRYWENSWVKQLRVCGASAWYFNLINFAVTKSNIKPKELCKIEWNTMCWNFVWARCYLKTMFGTLTVSTAKRNLAPVVTDRFISRSHVYNLSSKSCKLNLNYWVYIIT